MTMSIKNRKLNVYGNQQKPGAYKLKSHSTVRKSMKRIIVVALILGLFLILSSCIKNDKTSVGAEFFEWANRGTQVDTVVYAIRDTFYQTSVPSGEGSYLYIGQNLEDESFGIIRFKNLPDSGTVDTAMVTLYIHDIIGDDPVSLTPEVYAITGDWDEEEITREDFDAGNLRGERLEIEEISANSDSITFLLPPDIVQTWIDTTTAEDNHGFLFEYLPSADDFFIQFYSRDALDDSAQFPTLYLRISHDETSATHTRTSTADAFLATTRIEGTSDLLYIANGTTLRSLLYFNFDWLPDNATINSASLIMRSDTTLSFPVDTTLFQFNVFITSDEQWEIPEVSFDSTASTTGTLYGDSAYVNLAFFTQNWVTQSKENHGLILIGFNQNFNLDRRVFYSSKDSEKQPRVELFYSIPPSSRYEE